VGWSLASPGLIPLRFHLVLIRSFIVAIMFSAVTSLYRPSVCNIPGVSSVILGCSVVNLAGCIAQEGTGASVLAWAVHTILKKLEISIFCCG